MSVIGRGDGPVAAALLVMLAINAVLLVLC
jgi:hypothetical protein